MEYRRFLLITGTGVPVQKMSS